MQQNKIGIIGFGRFGRLLAEILAPEFIIYFYDENLELQQEEKFLPLTDLVKLPTVIFCMPINRFEQTLQNISAEITAQTVIDACSVKVYPTEWMTSLLPDDLTIIATHPMFGPDSYKSNTKKKMMMYCAQGDEKQFLFWQNYFAEKDIAIKLMTPEQHDREAAFSQNITHVIGRVLDNLHLHPSEIATKGYESLLTIIRQTCNDSEELFYDLLKYNPYSEEMLQRLEQSFIMINKELHLRK